MNQLKKNILLVIVIVSFTSILLSSGISAYSFIKSYHSSMDSQLKSTANILIDFGISDFSDPNDFEEFRDFIHSALPLRLSHTSIFIYDEKENLLFSSIGEIEKKSIKFPKNNKAIYFDSNYNEKRYRNFIKSYSITGKDNLIFHIQVSLPYPIYGHLIKFIWKELTISILSLGLFIFFISGYLIKKIIRPLDEFNLAIQSLNREEVNHWKKINISDDFEYLGKTLKTFNQITEKANTSVNHLDRMSRYIAHELRTPLTIMQGESELILNSKTNDINEYKKYIASSLEEIFRMNNIINHILKLGKIKDKQFDLKLKQIDINFWIKDYMNTRKLNYEFVSNKDKVFIDTDIEVFFIMFDNIIRNSLIHSKSDMNINISVEIKNQKIIIDIKDNGHGMNPELLHDLNSNNRFSPHLGIGLDLFLIISRMLNIKYHFKNLSPQGLQIQLELNGSRK